MDFNGFGGDLLCGFRREVLGHGRLLHERQACITQPGSVVNQQTGGFQIDGHPGQIKLHALELRNRLPKLPPLLRILHRMVQGSLSQARHLSADGNPALIQRFDGDLVALAHFAENVGGRHAAVIQNQLAGGRCANAHFVFLAPHRETGHTALHHKGRNAFVAGGRIGVGEQDKDPALGCVADPHLAAIEDKVIAIGPGGGGQGKSI